MCYIKYINWSSGLALIQKMGILILSYAIYDLEVVSQKYLMEFKFVSPFHILIYKGSLSIILCIFCFSFPVTFVFSSKASQLRII